MSARLKLAAAVLPAALVLMIATFMDMMLEVAALPFVHVRLACSRWLRGLLADARGEIERAEAGIAEDIVPRSPITAQGEAPRLH